MDSLYLHMVKSAETEPVDVAFPSVPIIQKPVMRLVIPVRRTAAVAVVPSIFFLLAYLGK